MIWLIWCIVTLILLISEQPEEWELQNALKIILGMDEIILD